MTLHIPPTTSKYKTTQQNILPQQELREKIIKDKCKNVKLIFQLIHMCSNGINSTAIIELAKVYEKFPQPVEKCIKDTKQQWKKWIDQLQRIVSQELTGDLKDKDINALFVLIGINFSTDETLTLSAAKEIMNRLFSTDRNTRELAAIALNQLHDTALLLDRRRNNRESRLLGVLERAAGEFALLRRGSFQHVDWKRPSTIIWELLRPYNELLARNRDRLSG